MITWSRSAEEELQRHIQRNLPTIKGTGADASEVLEDLRRHIDQEVSSANLENVTEEDVRRILQKMGFPDRSIADPSTQPPRINPPGTVILAFGVVLPALALLIEWITRMCASTFFDPLPSWVHVVLVASVPIIHFLTWREIREKNFSSFLWLSWLNAFALGVSLCYAIVFAPLYPAALFAIILFGWGLLPLSALLSFCAGISLRKKLRLIALNEERPPGTWRGLGLGVVSLLLLQLPGILTESGLRMAASDNPEKHLSGVRFLRAVGNRETLLRACYPRPGWARELNIFRNLAGGAISPEKAQSVYYEVTGEPFNYSPPPKLFSVRGGWQQLEEEFTWDPDVGGQSVAGRIKGLSMATSRMDGLIEPEAGCSYVEWTMEFKNDSSRQQEARSQILLPAGGVVSRLTLWIDGEEREAAFAGKGEVRKAYESVVQAKRDPVLVTMCGPDRILMQCFPVPPGGMMKVRVGVTAPLQMNSESEGLLSLPSIQERNFSVMSNFAHHIWIESSRPLASESFLLKTLEPRENVFVLKGELEEPQLAGFGGAFRVNLQPVRSWAANHLSSDSPVIYQQLVRTKPARPGRVVVVLDTSASMESYLPEFTKIWSRWPAEPMPILILASEAGTVLLNSDRATIDRKLKNLKARGGENNLPALIKAWDLAAEVPNGVILWIHGPQPVSFSQIQGLKQRLERGAQGPVVHDFPVTSGPNRVAEEMVQVETFQRVGRHGRFEEDLKRWIQRLTHPAYAFSRTTKPFSAEEENPGKEASFHLVRLWAYDQIKEFIRSRDPASAIAMAMTYHLVTPVSGAVVLETAQQYEMSGLTPMDASAAPLVPEPSTWALLVFGSILFLLWRRKSRARAVSVGTS